MAYERISKYCSDCDREALFGFNGRYKNGQPRFRPRCIQCDTAVKAKWRNNNSEKAHLHEEKAQKKIYARYSYERANNIRTEFYIHADSVKTAKKRGIQHSLSVDQIRDLIAKGCSYCGNRELRMTIDRIDNALGYVLDNVCGACIRCNYLRRDVPIAAWRELLPGIKHANEIGAFGDWTGDCRKSRCRKNEAVLEV